MKDIVKLKVSMIEELYIGTQLMGCLLIFIFSNYIFKLNNALNDKINLFIAFLFIYILLKGCNYFSNKSKSIQPKIYIAFIDGIFLLVFLYITKDYFHALYNSLYIYMVFQIIRFSNISSFIFSNFISMAYAFFIISQDSKKIISFEFVMNVLFFYLLSYILSSIIKENNYLEKEVKVMFDEIEEKNYILKEVAEKDYLTNMYNHRSFYNLLDEISKSTNVEKSYFCLALLDIDNFKKINDTYGHLAGDSILKEVSLIIQKNIREGDIAARYGGEEFAVILPKMDIKNGGKVCERIRSAIESHNFIVNNKKIKVTISGGVSCMMPCNIQHCIERQLKFVEHVDNLLYKAKDSGKNVIISSS